MFLLLLLLSYCVCCVVGVCCWGGWVHWFKEVWCGEWRAHVPIPLFRKTVHAMPNFLCSFAIFPLFVAFLLCLQYCSNSLMASWARLLSLSTTTGNILAGGCVRAVTAMLHQHNFCPFFPIQVTRSPRWLHSWVVFFVTFHIATIVSVVVGWYWREQR